MLRIHFSDADLLRVRISAEPDPMWEVLLSLHLTTPTPADRRFGTWRRGLPARLRRPAGILRTLSRPTGYSPDFLTPSVDVTDFDAGLDLVLSTPRAQLRDDIDHLAAHTPISSWPADLAAGDTRALRLLEDALRAYHDDAVRPYWETIRRQVGSDRRRRAELAMAHGFEAVLSTLHSSARWQVPVLELAYPVDQDLVLNGSGLTLVPSLFCWPGPITLLRQPERPVIVYPVSPDLGWAAGADTGIDLSLNTLLGRTRAEVLRTIADLPRVNTTDLARAAGISLASASQHTSVLRGAGLVTTARSGGSAIHEVSERGRSLLGN
jgi:DNA-binding transcriptional ArsR family regulator